MGNYQEYSDKAAAARENAASKEAGELNVKWGSPFFGSAREVPK